MSHFTVLVIMPKDFDADESDAEGDVARLMEPYDEDIEVDEYQRPCWCIGRAARDAAEVASLATFGDIDDMRKQLWDGAEEGIDDPTERFEAFQKKWKAAIEPRVAFVENFIKNSPDRDKPVPDCETCNGTGSYASTYNPKSRWDWYEIGGRWDGKLHPDGKNVFPLTELKPGWHVFAIVTPDGEWHQEAQMGWWGMTSNEDKDWPQKMYEIASSFPDHYGVLVDARI